MAKIPQNNPLKQNWTCSANGDKWECYEINSRTENLFAADADTANRDEIIAQALGWIVTNNPDNFCGGYYYSPNESGQPDSHKTKITGGKAQYKIGGNVTIQGGVEVQQGQRLITANQVTLLPNLKTNKIESIESSGDVNLRQPGQLIVSNNVKANIKDNTAELTDTYYLLKVNANPQSKLPKGYTDPHFTGYARGQAREITQYNKDQFSLKGATYSTCSPYNHDWQISASEIDIDKAKGWATVYNSTFDVQDIPVLYIPYITFPVNDKRKSGLLFPTAGTISNSIYYTQPYYFNLAPNYDFLFAPSYYTNRGVMLAGNFRYLTETNEGSIGAEYIPYDEDYGGGRAYFSITDNGQYTKNWSSNLNYSYATDQTFISDFSNNIVGANQALLEQTADINYIDDNLYFNASILNFQILDSVLYPVNTPYSTLPQIQFNAEFPTTIQNVSFGIKDQYTFFYRPQVDGQQLVNGQRLYLTPYIAFPFQSSWGYIKPSVAFSQTMYELTNTGQAISQIGTPLTTTGQFAYPDSFVNRSLPILNLSAGLYFDRNFSTETKTYNQTLEPKIFYNYIPYSNQDNIPLFDTSFTNFTYASLFAVNRFTGYDRINNANQLSYALETNINDAESGMNIFSAGVGQMYYFEEQQVTLCNSSGSYTGPGGTINNSNCIQNENPNYNQTFSSIAGYANYQFIKDWYAVVNMTYAPNNNNVDVQDYSIMFSPDPKHILNLGYQNIVNDYSLITPQNVFEGQGAPTMSLITGSGIWGLTEQISLVGLYSYSFSSSSMINMFAGLQYDECSWAVRFIYQRFISSLNTNNPTTLSGNFGNSFIFSFVLKGLGGTSQGSIEGLMETIPGYQPFYSGID
jgi:LPS-assembly protein